ncbi:MAG: hypothetical protein R2765_06085 [Ferruginibacter sp.]
MVTEDEPKKQLKLVEEKLEVIAKENAVNAKYEKVISEADSLLILKNTTQHFHHTKLLLK